MSSVSDKDGPPDVRGFYLAETQTVELCIGLIFLMVVGRVPL